MWYQFSLMWYIDLVMHVCLLHCIQRIEPLRVYYFMSLEGMERVIVYFVRLLSTQCIQTFSEQSRRVIFK